MVQCCSTSMADEGLLHTCSMSIVDLEQPLKCSHDVFRQLVLELLLELIKSPGSHIFSIADDANRAADQPLRLLGHRCSKAHLSSLDPSTIAPQREPALGGDGHPRQSLAPPRRSLGRGGRRGREQRQLTLQEQGLQGRVNRSRPGDGRRRPRRS